jgi:hypothetical protein
LLDRYDDGGFTGGNMEHTLQFYRGDDDETELTGTFSSRNAWRGQVLTDCTFYPLF